ncbi:hypothetical protein BV25DRAFT_1913082 [Artomyces pyxidatus]|uniref:Uncharacterized protein n=1 Tax=Artomyces pyxidatus TaxID=48021 RepID=A0ACB8TD55_9AGAM|nr:hypothetical protein BV25DRAFT_1913082 [Artomyces pyxidatus]
MSASAGQRKRTRASSKKEEVEEVVPEPEPLNHDETLWYPDGNIVLTAGETAFKVHRSILTKESKELEDILSAGSERLEEGCPVYAFEDDSDKDLGYMLEFLYGLNRNYSQVKRLPFDIVSALCRLGAKYKMQRVRDEAVSRLRACYPDTLAGYNKMPFKGEKERPIEWTDGQDYAVVKLALQEDDELRSVLPLALYECCRDPPKFIVENMDELSDEHNVWMAIWRRLFIGRVKLAESRAEDTFCFIGADVSEKCATSKSCAAALKGMVESIYKTPGVINNNPNSLELVYDLIDDKTRRKACRDCLLFWKALHLDGRAKAWGKLVDIFQLPIPEDETASSDDTESSDSEGGEAPEGAAA